MSLKKKIYFLISYKLHWFQLLFEKEHRKKVLKACLESEKKQGSLINEIILVEKMLCLDSENRSLVLRLMQIEERLKVMEDLGKTGIAETEKKLVDKARKLFSKSTEPYDKANRTVEKLLFIQSNAPLSRRIVMVRQKLLQLRDFMKQFQKKSSRKKLIDA